MRAPQEMSTIVASNLDEAFRYGLDAMVPVAPEPDGAGEIVLFTGEGRTPALALADAVDAIRELAATHDTSPVHVIHDGLLRTDEGYRVWGSLTLGDGAMSRLPAVRAHIEPGEEGTWTVTITRS